MDARNLTELRKANDDNKPNHADKSGGITIDVLPTGGVLLGTLKIQLLEQMPLRGDPAHPHFIPMLSRPPLRPRNLPQQPHTMKTPTTPQQIDCSTTRSLADHMATEARRRRESMLEKQAIRLALMSRHNPEAKAALIEFVNSQREAVQ
jgi:hypothetical protein